MNTDNPHNIVADSDLAVIGLPRINPIRKYPYWTCFRRIGPMKDFILN